MLKNARLNGIRSLIDGRQFVRLDPVADETMEEEMEEEMEEDEDDEDERAAGDGGAAGDEGAAGTEAAGIGMEVTG
eukprot:6488894-Prymnesium_polylepis.1